MPFYLYILRCSDGSYYIGHTDRLEYRTACHHAGEEPGYTQRRRPVELVWYEEFPSRIEALERERQLKRWSKRKKEALIASDWAKLQRLSSRARSSG